VLPSPAAALEFLEGRGQIVHPVDEERSLSLQMVGQQHERRSRRQRDRRHSGPHAVDREDDPAAEDPFEVREVGRDVPAGDVQEIQLLERARSSDLVGARVPRASSCP
jgi:hypothetical protein